jgi:hypothetical protein
MLTLADDMAVSRMKAALFYHKPDIVVFDPLTEFFEGESENDAVAMRDSYRKLRGIARAGKPDAACLIAHHSKVGKAAVAGGLGWDRGAYGRGSKALYSSVRAQINVIPASADDPDILILACGKNNNGRHFDRRAVRHDVNSRSYVVDHDFDFELWEAEVSSTKRTPTPGGGGLATRKKAVSKELESGQKNYTHLYTQILKQCGCSESTAKSTIKTMRAMEEINCDEKTGLYSLP